MFTGLPNVANKNLVFDPATLSGHQETMPPRKELTIQCPMHSLRMFKSINTFAKPNLSFSLKMYNMREQYTEEVSSERRKRQSSKQGKHQKNVTEEVTTIDPVQCSGHVSATWGAGGQVKGSNKEIIAENSACFTCIPSW